MPKFAPRALILPALFFFPCICLNQAIGQSEQQRTDQIDRAVIKEAERHGVEAELGDAGDELSQQLDFDVGAFVRFSYFRNDDADGTHIKRITDVRAWANLTYKDMHQFYTRVKGEWIDYNAGTQYFYDDENDSSVPRLDVGYYQCNLNNLLGIGFERFRFKTGRDYYRAGDGLCLDKRGDGVGFETTSELGPGKILVKGLLMKTIKSDDHWDRSRPDFSEDERLFQAAQIDYEFSREFVAFFYGINQVDKNRKRFHGQGIDQEYGFDSHFLGLGLRGEVGAGLTYSGEYAKQSGDLVAEGTNKEEDVDAYAYTGQVEYTFRSMKSQPRLSFQYIQGSGDRDAGNTLDTIGGNQAGTDYNAFTQFGYVNTGLVFYPNVSNLRILRLGGAVSLLKDHPETVDLEVGFNAFRYNRVHDTGGFSDRSVIFPGRSYVGREVDVYIMWRPFTDVSCMAQYGVFVPSSDVFEDDAKRTYVSVGVTIYF